jgi:hypothetical protein
MKMQSSRSRVCVLASFLVAIALVASYAVLATAQTRGSARRASATSDLGTLLGVEASSAAPTSVSLSRPVVSREILSGPPAVTGSYSRRPPVSWFYPF